MRRRLRQPATDEGARCDAPSKANPGDIPTRPDRWHEMSPTAEFIEMKIPPIAEIENDIAGWIARVRGMGGDG